MYTLNYTYIWVVHIYGSVNIYLNGWLDECGCRPLCCVCCLINVSVLSSNMRVIFTNVFTSTWGGGPGVSTAAFHAWVRGSVPGLGGLKKAKMFLPHPRVKVSIVGSLRDREVACSNPVSGGQCHLNHLTILRRFSWSSLAYMCTKVA